MSWLNLAETSLVKSRPSVPYSANLFTYLITWTSNVKYFFKFLMIMTRNGSLMPSVCDGSAGHVRNVVLQTAITNSRN